MAGQPPTWLMQRDAFSLRLRTGWRIELIAPVYCGMTFFGIPTSCSNHSQNQNFPDEPGLTNIVGHFA
jgi:hypothetical protein